MVRWTWIVGCVIAALPGCTGTSCDSSLHGYTVAMQRTVDAPASDVAPNGIQVCVDASCTDLAGRSSDGTTTAASGGVTVSFAPADGGKLTMLARIAVNEGKPRNALTVRFKRTSTGEAIVLTGAVQWARDDDGCHDHPVATDV